MFKFENETYLYALLLIPVFLLLFRLSVVWRRKAMARFGEHRLVSRLMPDFSERKLRNKFILYLFAFAFIVVGLANPQVGTKLEKVKRKGIDVMIAMDVSKSMMAEDIQPNRLERARQLVSRLIGSMKDDRVGIIVFAGHAYLQMPLTVDYAAAKLFLQTINTDIVPTQGTAIGEAIDLAIGSFDEEQKKHKALIVISDGENHEEGAVEMAERAASENLLVYTLGIGSEAGGSIPVMVNGRKVGYKRDKNGNMVVSKLDPATLKEVAQISGGEYVHIQGARNEVSEVIDILSNIEKRDFEDRVFTDYADQFQYFIGIALLLILIEFFTSERKSGWFRKWSFFGQGEEKAAA